MTAAKRLMVIGAGGHGRAVLEAARLAGWDVVGILDDDERQHGRVVDGVDVVGGVADLVSYQGGVDTAIVALGNATVRERVQAEVRRLEISLACIVHPRASVAESALLADGTVVLAGATINVGASVGEGCIVNCNAMIDHDARIEAFVHVAPLVGVGARARVGRGATLGMGARVLADAIVDSDMQVPAGALVQRRAEC